jgi:hypothetical protein
MVLSALEAVPFCSMSRRIDIELTSALGDGTWTWRAAGARQPKGVLDSSVLPADPSVGDIFKVDIEQEIDGITVLGVVQTRQKAEPAVIELLPAERDFQPVVETRAKRDRNDRGSRDGDRRPRRDRDDRGGRGGGRGDGRGRDGAGPGRGADGRGDGRGRDGGGGRTTGRGGGGGRRGPSFTPPPEIPQRPKPKRLRPGKTHRNAVLADLPQEQRAIAELALQGMGAVRQRVREENTKAVAEGRAEMPEASVMKIAEELLPKLRLAEWQDRAEAALKQMEHLDLRDLRSVVAASGDPTVARDEGSTALVIELKAALVHKQEQELLLWFGDVDAALAVGRVIRALRLSSQPPKAGVPFPVDIAQRLVDSVNASLAPTDSPERWSATLEAAAFSPVRALIMPARKPDVVNDDLLATVKRLAPALPQIAAMFEIEVDPKASMPKPLRTNPRQHKDGEHAGKGGKGKGGKGKQGGRTTDERRPKRSDKPSNRQPDAAAPARAVEPLAGAAAPVAASAAPAEPTAPDQAPASAAAAEAPATTDAAPAQAPASAAAAEAPATTDAAPAQAPATAEATAPAQAPAAKAPATTDAAPAQAPATAEATAPAQAPATAEATAPAQAPAAKAPATTDAAPAQAPATAEATAPAQDPAAAEATAPAQAPAAEAPATTDATAPVETTSGDHGDDVTPTGC